MSDLYAIQQTTEGVPQPHYVAKPVLGGLSQHVNDARTWKTERGARDYAHKHLIQRSRSTVKIVRVQKVGRFLSLVED